MVDVIAPNGAIDFMPHLGTPIAVSMQDADTAGVARHFHGLIFEAHYTGATDQGAHYRLTAKPWLALLASNQNTRIFQDMSVPDILRSVLTAAGHSSDFHCDAGGSHEPRTYCVQYRESDFSFLSRLMEEEGLYYYFAHSADRHMLCICEQPAQHPYVPGVASIPFIASDGNDRTERPPHLWHWDERVTPGPARVALRDYSFLQPANTFEGQANATAAGPAESAELYDHPGGHGAHAVGTMARQKDQYAGWRLEAARANRRTYTGQGDVFAAGCGDRFSLRDFPDGRQNTEYLIVSASHAIFTEAYRSGESASGRLQVDIEAVPAATQWRSRLRTPKPVAGGPQTATVVGPSGRAIYVDKHGRVKVQFHWDRIGKFDAASSCWIRVSQAWADSTFGTMMIPRVGEEVLVDFIDGDPDQPIVTGRVYNPSRDVPYPLPENETRSTWKSRTVGRSGDYSGAEEPPPALNGFNEIRFEDKGASEELFVHAQRNMNSWVRLDQGHKVGRDANVRVGRNRQTNVRRNETLVVEDGDETRSIQSGSRSTDIKQSDVLTVLSGDSTTTVQSGDYSVTVSRGKVLVDARQEILLRVGENTLRLSPQGLEVQALNVSINASMSLSAQSMVGEVKAAAQLTINGLPVKVN